jgi:Domain of unknown function (DUF4136)
MMTTPTQMSTRLVAALLVAGLAFGVMLEAEKIKVRAEPDPDFDFSSIRSWAWDDDAGDVIMARQADDDPAPLEARIDPLIRRYVAEALARKPLPPAAGAEADVQLHYYVLVSLNVSGQQMGQFLPATPYWGLPPFAPATTALKVVTRGTLVLDAMLPGTVGERRVVWRGVAQSTVGDNDSPGVRDARLREASTELVKRFPAAIKKQAVPAAPARPGA